jgi:hypothetical protein
MIVEQLAGFQFNDQLLKYGLHNLFQPASTDMSISRAFKAELL